MKKIIAAIDVGTTKICTIIGSLDSGGNVQVLGVGLVPSHGMHKGMVVNVEEARESVAESIRRAEQASGLKVESAYVGVTGRHISSINSHGVVAIPRNDRLVRHDDLKRVLSSAQQVNIPDDRRILHAIPATMLWTLRKELRIRLVCMALDWMWKPTLSPPLYPQSRIWSSVSEALASKSRTLFWNRWPVAKQY